MLQKKFEEFKTDLNRSKERVSALNEMGQQLLAADHSSSTVINKELRLTNRLWEILESKTITRDKILAAAKEIHEFNRDAFEAKGRILVCLSTKLCNIQQSIYDLLRKKKYLYHLMIMVKTWQVYRHYNVITKVLK